jgi:outer membrane protein assembly factor BamB
MKTGAMEPALIQGARGKKRRRSVARSWFLLVVGAGALLWPGVSCRMGEPGPAPIDHLEPQPGPLNSPWPLFQGNARHTGKSAYNGPIPTPVVVSRTQISATASPTNSAPVLDNSNRAYAGTNADDDYETKVDNYLYAFTPEGGVYFRYRVDPGAVKDGTTNGTQSWTIQSAPAIADDGTIYAVAAEEAVTSARGIKLFAINPNGTLKWSVDVCSGNNACSDIVRSSPNIDSTGRIIVAYRGSSASDTHLKAFNSSNGSLSWDYTSSNILHTSPAIASDGTIYILDYYNLKALDSTGTLRWTYSLGSPAAESWENSPSVGSDGTIYVATRGSSPKVFAINPSNGSSTTAKWSVSISSKAYGAPAIDEAAGYIYVATEAGIFRLAISNGAGNSSPWYSTSRPVVTSPIVDAAGNVYFAEKRGALYSVSPSATLRWKIDGLGLDGGGLAIGSNNRLYMTTDDGYFVVIANQPSPVSDYLTNTWHIRYVIIREAWPNGSGSQRERITAAQESDIDAKMQEFAWKVRDLYSQGILNIVLNKQVIEGTATTNSGDCSGGWYSKGTQFDATVYNYPYGTYDTVIYFWGGSPVPGYSAINSCGIWGITYFDGPGPGPRASALGGAGRISIHYLPGYDHVEVIEHEWEHTFLDDSGAITVHNGISDPLVTDTHNGWSLLRVKPFAWSDADNIDPLGTTPFASELLTIGCFDQAPYGNFPYGMFKAFVSEATTQPQAGQTEGGKTWTKTAAGGDGLVDLYSKYWPDTGTKDCVGYVHLYVKSNTAQDLRLWITASGDIRFFLNNRRFRDSNDLRDFVYGRYGYNTSGTWKDSYGVGVHLESGWNRILVKTAHKAGYVWKIGMRLANRDGTAPSGLTYCADKPGTGTCPP